MLKYLLLLPVAYALVCPSGSSLNNPLIYTYDQLLSSYCTSFSNTGLFGYIVIKISNQTIENLSGLPRSSGSSVNIFVQYYIDNNPLLLTINDIPIYEDANIPSVQLNNNTLLMDCGILNPFDTLILMNNTNMVNCTITNTLRVLYIKDTPIRLLVVPSITNGGQITLINTALISVNIPTWTGSISVLIVLNNTKLLSIVLPIQTVTATLSISNNPLLSTISFPSLTQSTTAAIDISNNDNIVFLNTFNNLNSLSRLSINNNLRLQTIDILHSTTSIKSLIIDNNPSLSAILNTQLSSLSDTLRVTMNPKLLNYNGISHIATQPMNMDFSGSCCPDVTFFNNFWVLDSFNGCVLCASWSISGPSIVSSEGGVTIYIQLIGQRPFTITNFRFGQYNNITSTINDATYSCITPSHDLGNAEIFYSLNKQWLTTGLFVNYVPFAEYSQISQSDTTIGIVDGTEYSGIPKNVDINIVIFWFAISWVIFIFIVILSIMIPYKKCGYYRCLPNTLRTLDCIFVPRLDKTNKNNYGFMIRRRKTVGGGVVTILLVLVVLCFLVIYLTSTIYSDNVVTIGYIPSKTTGIADSTYSISVDLYGKTKCDSKQFNTAGISGTSDLQVYKEDNHCYYSWRCEGCSITDSIARLSIFDNDPNSFLYSVDWSVDIIDYYNRDSVISGVINSSPGSFFKGSNTPKSSLTVNPTIFSNDNVKLSGYTLAFYSQSKGTELSPSTFAVDTGSGFIIDLIPSTLTVNIEVFRKHTNIDIVVGLFGFVTGCVAIARILSSAINFYHNRQNDKSAKEAAERLEEERKKKSEVTVSIEMPPPQKVVEF